MILPDKSRFLKLPADLESALISGARDGEPVKGLTHGYYKYPARFSPAFAKAAIETFTQPGDLCLDHHVGGGTTLVEALALGRHAVGVDISTLASFVAETKTIVFMEHELKRLASWRQTVCAAINMHKRSVCFTDYAERGYYKHLNHPKRWRLRKAIEQGLESACQLENKRLEAFGRCAVLRTAQWALDGRSSHKTIDISAFRTYLSQQIDDMIEGGKALSAAASLHASLPIIEVINRSSIGLEDDWRNAERAPPRLVITSPPYAGVHILYHRWQFGGGKEAALPFMIAGKLDGAGSSYYTMGDRKYPELKTYFDNISATMKSAATVSNHETVFVQMVAFSEPEWQLPRYLEAMEDAGLTEIFLTALKGERDGRLWRSVPGRRWYSAQRGATPGSQEVVLFHRKSKTALPLSQA